MKKCKIFMLILIITLIFMNQVNAIDINTKGRISGTYGYDDEKFNNLKAYLYKIADIDENENYIYLNTFKEFEKDINSLTTSGWGEYALDIFNYLVDKNIPYSYSVTISDGEYQFNDLGVGLYLLYFEDISDEYYTYSSSPLLLCIPSYDDLSYDYIYDLSVKAKVEKLKNTDIVEEDDKQSIDDDKKIDEPSQSNDDNNVNTPKTYDDIIKYVVIFIIAAIVFIVLICYIDKFVKKREEVKK